ncbi:hypothetical protein AB205_0089980 [Aquarana catesbeiana]|uniref:Uncharacterized protein n=1 Tax=Aquarana catesbeiana TaxID=8400 RepID=A0A2G9QA48_AQUCT|nr:hypothetical protein AB205_0089980 [Aquarana catesbeiana]
MSAVGITCFTISHNCTSAAFLFVWFLKWRWLISHRQGSSLKISMNTDMKSLSFTKISMFTARHNTRQSLMSDKTLLILLQYRLQCRSSIGTSLSLTFVLTIGASNAPSSAHRSYVIRTRVKLYTHCACV